MNPTIRNHKETIIGYKVFKKDENGIYIDGLGNAEKHYFEVGKTYKTKGKPILCKKGFPFFRHYCFAVDYLGTGNVIHRIEASSNIQEDTEKGVTNNIKILEEVYLQLDGRNNNGRNNNGIKNNGHENNGYMNNGSRNNGNKNNGCGNNGYGNNGYENNGYENNGHRNNGNGNKGNGNNGHNNNGCRNNGCGNNGYENNGYENNGDENNGHRNNGNRNNGTLNNGNNHNGVFNIGNGYFDYFCTEEKFFLFDIEVTKNVIDRIPTFMKWFDLDIEKKDPYKSAWKKCPKETLLEFSKIKEFQTKEARRKFFQITGRRLPK